MRYTQSETVHFKLGVQIPDLTHDVMCEAKESDEVGVIILVSNPNLSIQTMETKIQCCVKIGLKKNN